MPEITTEVQDTNSKINQRIQEEEVTGNAGMQSAEGEVLVEVPAEVKFAKELEIGANIVLGKEKAKRNKAVKPVTTGKVPTAADMIARLEGKMKMLKYIDSISVPVVETGLSKEEREILLEVGKQIEKIKSDTVQKISKL